MKYPLRLTHRQMPDFFSLLCDVVERDMLGIPDDDPFMHTSTEARDLALKIEERLANEGYLEYR